MKNMFLEMLADPTLKTVGEYLGNIMIRNPEKSVEFAAEYDLFRQPSHQLVEFISQYIHPNNDKIGLDVGCGSGNYTFPFSDKFKKIVGIDLNDKLLEIAIEKSRKYRNNNTEFIKVDAVCTSFEPNSFDAIWSVSTMHYLRGERQLYFLKECYRILKRGGILIIDVGEFLEQHPSLWVKEYFPFLKERYKNSLFSSINYESWLNQIGFSDIKCIPIEYNFGENDHFIRAGQRNPDLYLNDDFIKANPAFREMPSSELIKGQDDIRRDKENGTLNEIISRCQRQATMSGDLGFIVAKR